MSIASSKWTWRIDTVIRSACRHAQQVPARSARTIIDIEDWRAGQDPSPPYATRSAVYRSVECCARGRVLARRDPADSMPAARKGNDRWSRSQEDEPVRQPHGPQPGVPRRAAAPAPSWIPRSFPHRAMEAREPGGRGIIQECIGARSRLRVEFAEHRTVYAGRLAQEPRLEVWARRIALVKQYKKKKPPALQLGSIFGLEGFRRAPRCRSSSSAGAGGALATDAHKGGWERCCRRPTEHTCPRARCGITWTCCCAFEAPCAGRTRLGRNPRDGRAHQAARRIVLLRTHGPPPRCSQG